jgi:pSer/pThr/pTyr-binding forkhead associated (FHA) protein
MELSIKLLTGRSAGQEIRIPVNKFLIGRAEDCHLRPHSDLISRHHCVLLVEEGVCAVRDFNSRNGTLVNEEAVVGQRELHNGDRLKVGNLEFEIQLTCSVGGKKRPKVKNVKEVAQRTAGSAATSDEEDISDWLTGSEENSDTKRVDVRETARAPHETPAMGISNSDTTFIKSKTEETTTVKPLASQNAQPAEMPPEAAAEANRGAESAKRLFGAKLVAVQQNAPKDSREAAADALKRLFNTRKP